MGSWYMLSLENMCQHTDIRFEDNDALSLETLSNLHRFLFPLQKSLIPFLPMQKLQMLWLCAHLLRFSLAMLSSLACMNCKVFNCTSSANIGIIEDRQIQLLSLPVSVLSRRLPVSLGQILLVPPSCFHPFLVCMSAHLVSHSCNNKH